MNVKGDKPIISSYFSFNSYTCVENETSKILKTEREQLNFRAKIICLLNIYDL